MIDERIAQARKMRAEDKMTYREIGDVFDVGPDAIRRALNPEVAQTEAEYYQNHKEKVRLYNEKHKEKKRLVSAKWRKEHMEEMRLYRQVNKEHYRLYFIERRKDKEFRKRGNLYCANYYKKHKEEFNAYSAMRRALKLAVTVGNLAEIKEIYRCAKEDPKVRCYLCGKLISIGHRHVDHIVPLSKGGAHRPSNLAVACDDCNLCKCDKMPEEIGVLL